MRSEHEQEDVSMVSTQRELLLLTEVSENPSATQRQLSVKLDTALGLTNVLLRRLVKKGYIKIVHASWNRRLYSLTPDGFARRIHVTVSYIQRVLGHYQNVRSTLREQMEALALHKESRLAVYGTDEFAELVFLGLREIGVEEIEMFTANGKGGGTFLGMPVQNVETLKPETCDMILITLLNGADEVREELVSQGIPEENVVTFFTVNSAAGKK